MKDVKLFKSVGAVGGTAPVEVVQAGISDAPLTSPLEILASKVTRFMLTSIGSDAIEPLYGSYFIAYTQLAYTMMPKFKADVVNDLSRCLSYIRRGESGDEQLQSISLVEAQFTNPTSIVLKINIRTNLGNSAMLQLPVSANG